MVEKTQINLRLDPEQKDAWETYVDESGEFSTVTGLIRASVEREIANEQNSDRQSPALESDIGELKSDVERIRKNVIWLREQQQDEQDIGEFAQEILGQLKPLNKSNEPPDEADKLQDGLGNDVSYEELQAEKDPQTVEVIANKVNADSREVQEAIEYLKNHYVPIVEVEVDNRIHYFVEEGA